MTGNIQKGREGEKIAEEFLTAKGYKLLHKNFRYGRNEIDLIFVDESNRILIFVEVKTRQSKEFGEPEESITPKKQEGFKKAVEGFVNTSAEFRGYDLRIDTVGILLTNSRPVINHIENSFY